MSNWLTYSPSSGYGDGTIRITASTYSELEERVATLIGYNTHYNLTASTTVTQDDTVTGYTAEYLTFDVKSAGTLGAKCRGLVSNQDLYYSKNSGGTWTKLQARTGETGYISVQPGDIVWFKATIYDGITFFGTAKFEVYGNIMSLYYGDDFAKKKNNFAIKYQFRNCTGLTSAENLVLPATSLVASAYYGLFSGCTNLTKAPQLPATTLADNCYNSMFLGCTSLTTAPTLQATTLADSCYNHMFGGAGLTAMTELPATTLAYGCYRGMFKGTSITSIPYNYLPATALTDGCYFEMFSNCTGLTSGNNIILPATTLADSCYAWMFRGCSNLTSIPLLPATEMSEGAYAYMFAECGSLTSVQSLPATTLADSCYNHMFAGAGLTTAPVLSATTLASNCYTNMFEGCTRLTTVPSNMLPATSLTDGCYSQIFRGCTSLTNVPELPATTLVPGCYGGMFIGCSSLSSVPSNYLPVTTLADKCYISMFAGCSNLTTAPDLPATTLTTYCYYYMFQGCYNLNYIKCLATDISAEDCTDDWVAAVAQNGTFVKNANMSGWTTGNNGIPSGWTVIDYNPGGGNVEFIFAATEDYGEFNIEITSIGVDNVVNVDGISENGTLATGFTSATTFSVGVQNLNSLGQGSRHIGISYAYSPSYNYVEVAPGNFTWQSGLQFELGKKVYIQVY